MSTEEKKDITPEQVAAAIAFTAALGAAIKELGGVSAGHLYAQVCLPLNISLGHFNGAIGLLKRQGLVVETNHMLRWIEPQDTPPEMLS